MRKVSPPAEAQNWPALALAGKPGVTAQSSGRLRNALEKLLPVGRVMTTCEGST